VFLLLDRSVDGRAIACLVLDTRAGEVVRAFVNPSLSSGGAEGQSAFVLDLADARTSPRLWRTLDRCS